MSLDSGIAINDADRRYHGSRFAEVRDAIFANPYQKPWGGSGSPRLPRYQVTLGSVLRGLLSFGKGYVFRQAVERTVDSHADLRWGAEGKGFRRLLHPNGVCLTGLWEITEPTEYSGHFASASQGLLIARYSSCCTETRRGRTRSLAMAGKLYPTTDPNHTEPLRPANFFTQEDIAGAHTNYINDAELRNAPDVHAYRRGWGTPIILIEGLVFQIADREPAHRQVYQIAELGKAESEPTRCPQFMRLLVSPEQPRIEGEDLDFRDEIMAQIYDRGEPVPRRTLTFNIEVAADGTRHGPALLQRRTFSNWRRIGRIVFNHAVISYNCDFVFHFNHPTWRDDRNNPSTATRVNERKVH
jgi:hypothetical protein